MEKVNSVSNGVWAGNGTGPKPVNGGEWVSGASLVPPSQSVPPAGETISTIYYDWSACTLNGWDDQVKVQLLLKSGSNTVTYDVSSSKQGTANLASKGFPANCTIYFQMKVGTIATGLYEPPYITEDQVQVYY